MILLHLLPDPPSRIISTGDKIFIISSIIGLKWFIDVATFNLTSGSNY